jgi:hypothetical protein
LRAVRPGRGGGPAGRGQARRSRMGQASLGSREPLPGASEPPSDATRRPLTRLRGQNAGKPHSCSCKWHSLLAMVASHVAGPVGRRCRHRHFGVEAGHDFARRQEMWRYPHIFVNTLAGSQRKQKTPDAASQQPGAVGFFLLGRWRYSWW